MKVEDNYKYVETDIFKFEFIIVTDMQGPRIFRNDTGMTKKKRGVSDADTMYSCTFRLLHIDGVLSNYDKMSNDDFVDEWYWCAEDRVERCYARRSIERQNFFENMEELLTYWRVAAQDAGYSDFVDFILSGKYFLDGKRKFTKKRICDYLDAVAAVPDAMKQKDYELSALSREMRNLSQTEVRDRRRAIINHYTNPFPMSAKLRDEITLGLVLGAVENFLVRNGFRERGK